MNEIYVLAQTVGPNCVAMNPASWAGFQIVGVSANLEALKRRAEKKQQAYASASEFKWERDKWTMWTERLPLRYVSKSTGRWNKSNYFIDKVPLLDAEEGET